MRVYSTCMHMECMCVSLYERIHTHMCLMYVLDSLLVTANILQVIKEYKVVKDTIPSEPSIMHWKQPDFCALHHFICSQLGWEKEYVSQKILGLMTQWVIRQYIHSQQTRIKHITDIQPLRILKHRVNGGVHMSEVEWTSLSGKNAAVSKIAYYMSLYHRCN